MSTSTLANHPSLVRIGENKIAPTTVKTAGYTAVPGDFVPVNASAGNVTVTLPAAPADKARVAVKLVAVSGSFTATVACGGTDKFNTSTGPTTATLQLVNQAVIVQYQASTGLWYVQSTDLPLSGSDARYAQVATANVFATQQTVEGNVIRSRAADSTQPLITIAATADTDSTHFGGAINYYGAGGLPASKMCWNTGIDVAAAVPYRDFFIAKANGDGSVSDFFYLMHGGAAAATACIGWVPGNPAYAFCVTGNDGANQGGQAIRVNAANTGIPWALIDSATGNPWVYFDKGMALNTDPASAGGNGGFVINATQQAGSTYPRRVLTLADKDGTGAFGFQMAANGTMKFRYHSGGTDIVQWAGNAATWLGANDFSQTASIVTLGNATVADNHNLTFGTTTGTKIGTLGGAAGQKLAFWNSTPVVQPLLATGAAHTVDDVITMLQTLGLCRQA